MLTIDSINEVDKCQLLVKLCEGDGRLKGHEDTGTRWNNSQFGTKDETREEKGTGTTTVSSLQFSFS